LTRAINRLLVRRIARLTTTFQIKFGDLVVVDEEKGDLVCFKTAEAMLIKDVTDGSVSLAAHAHVP
jgi:hypothetical protein